MIIDNDFSKMIITNVDGKYISKKQLKKAYSKIICSKVLNPAMTQRTGAECIIEKYLKKIGIEYLTQVWVGNRNIDILIPSLSLSVEVNGSIHDRSFKISQDLHLMRELKYLGIDVISVRNYNNQNYQDIKHAISSYILKDSGLSKNDLLYRVQLITLLRFYNEHCDLFDFFTKKERTLIERLIHQNKLRKRKLKFD